MTLALHGGKPVRKTFLPYGRQVIDASDRKAVDKVLRSDFLTTGPAVQALEKDFIKRFHFPHPIAVANGTAALHAAIRLLHLQPGEEVITSPITFAATSNAVLYEGGRVRFSDMGTDGNLDPLRLQENLRLHYKKTSSGHLKHKKTGQALRAVIVVHFAGLVADMTPFYKLARQYKFSIVEDASHALGAKYPDSNRYVGDAPGSLAVTFSFHPVKLIAAGEGGLVVVRKKGEAASLRSFRHHGVNLDSQQRARQTVAHQHSILDLGYNYRLSDIHSALALSQLKKLKPFLSKRRALAKAYKKELRTIEGISDAAWPQRASNHAWHLYVIRLQLKMFKGSRDQIFTALRAENIGVNVHYLPVYQHQYYQTHHKDSNLNCKLAGDYYSECLTLPLHVGMNENDIGDVIQALEKVLSYYRR